MDQQHHSELQKLCLESGFQKRGKAYFRIVGDGVLQVIKSEYERVFRAEVINIGLFSMYDVLLPQWFTATGCIPRYSVVNCFYQNNMPLVCAPSYSLQINMLRERVINWLDSIDNQKKLIMAITKLDCRWNDELKIGPYLACGEINHAKKVVREIVGQHSFAWESKVAAQDDLSKRAIIRHKLEDDALYWLLELISRENPNEIEAYLKKNYERNMGYARFCTKNNNDKKE